jgi:hypothetical protein
MWTSSACGGRCVNSHTKDLVRFIVSQPVGWELTQVYFKEGPQPYEDLVEFQLTIGSEWVLMNEHERRALELRHGRRLRLSEAFATRVDIPTSLALHKDPDCVKQLHDMQRKHKDDERAKEAAKRLALVPELDAAIPNCPTTSRRSGSTTASTLRSSSRSSSTRRSRSRARTRSRRCPT